MRGDERAVMMALKICWVRLLRLLRERTKIVFENKKEKEKIGRAI